MKGWVLDVGADNESNCMVIWLKGENGSVKKCECAFTPAFYVYSSPADLVVLEQTLEGDPLIKALEYDEKRLWPGESARKVLKISLSDYRVLMKLAREIDEMGDFFHYELFNVDISIPFAYMFERNLIPMTSIELTDDCKFKLLEDVDSIDYTIPDLSSIELNAKVNARGNTNSG